MCRSQRIRFPPQAQATAAAAERHTECAYYLRRDHPEERIRRTAACQSASVLISLREMKPHAEREEYTAGTIYSRPQVEFGGQSISRSDCPADS